MRKKIIATSMIAAFLVILFAKPATAQAVAIYAWTDRRQYEPGETGTLYFTVHNTLGESILVVNISIVYDNWHAYVRDHWEGNETFTFVDKRLAAYGGVYTWEVTFTVPTGGRGVSAEATITIDAQREAGVFHPSADVDINVVGLPGPRMIEDIDVWMTSLIAAVVICTIILAIAVFLSTRRAPAPRFAAPPPPPKPKAKAEAE